MLNLFVKSLKTFSRELKRLVRREISFYKAKPTVATLFLTYRCTSRCSTCTIWRRPKENVKELGLLEWKRIVEQLHKNNIKAVELFGGDIFLRKDILIPLIRFLKEQKMIIHLPTNANLLTEEIAKQLVKNEVDHIYISVDGIENLQDKIRGVDGTFERVSRAVSFLTQARDGKKIPKLICNTTVSNLNIDFLEEIPAFAHKMGFDENHFEYVGEFSEEHVEQSIIDGLKPTPYYMKQGDSVLLNKEDAIRLKNTLWKIRKKFAYTNLGILTVNIDALPLKDIYQGTINNKKCYVMRKEVTVDPYGNVMPCMCFNNYFLGNLTKSDFVDIWNNTKNRRFIAQQKSGSLDLCKHCILGVQRNHSFYTGLKRIYYTHIQDWYLEHIYKGSDSLVTSENISSVSS